MNQKMKKKEEKLTYHYEISQQKTHSRLQNTMLYNLSYSEK